MYNTIEINGLMYDIVLPYGKNLTEGNYKHLMDYCANNKNISDIEYWAFNNISIKLNQQ